MTLSKKSYIQYEPKGVVLVMGAWNAPIAISLVPVDTVIKFRRVFSKGISA
jgi:acyl-CoA reductase-like NAD-dependent aldehyde dehydrogenase